MLKFEKKARRFQSLLSPKRIIQNAPGKPAPVDAQHDPATGQQPVVALKLLDVLEARARHLICEIQRRPAIDFY